MKFEEPLRLPLLVLSLFLCVHLGFVNHADRFVVASHSLLTITVKYKPEALLDVRSGRGTLFLVRHSLLQEILRCILVVGERKMADYRHREERLEENFGDGGDERAQLPKEGGGDVVEPERGHDRYRVPATVQPSVIDWIVLSFYHVDAIRENEEIVCCQDRHEANWILVNFELRRLKPVEVGVRNLHESRSEATS